MVIPAPSHAQGHYNIVNALVGALLFSYAPFAAALSPLVAMAMYGTYAHMALARRRCAGLQCIRLAAQPGTALFSFAPFVIANVWYVLRMLRQPTSPQGN